MENIGDLKIGEWMVFCHVRTLQSFPPYSITVPYKLIQQLQLLFSLISLIIFIVWLVHFDCVLFSMFQCRMVRIFEGQNFQAFVINSMACTFEGTLSFTRNIEPSTKLSFQHPSDEAKGIQ